MMPRCPFCTQAADVSEDASTGSAAPVKLNVCPAGHTWHTIEVPLGAARLAERQLLGAVQRFERDCQRLERDRAIRADPREAAVVAAAHKISPARVRQIRAEGRDHRFAEFEAKIKSGANHAQSSTQKARKS